jgi:predicted peroxiredoxin
MASGSTNTTATTVAISGLSAIALQDNGAALTAGQHAAGKMFMGILNTTSTVQIMQVQVSGTDPLIISSLTVDGNSQFNGTITAGVNDTGYDVQFFGATSGAHLLWDESADDLKLVGAAGLTVAGGSTLNTLNVNQTITAGADDAGYDVQFFGATSGAHVLWDASEDEFKLVGATDLTVAGTSTLNFLAVNQTITAGADDDGYDVQFFGATASSHLLWDASEDDLKLVGAAGLTVAGGSTLNSLDVNNVATAATFEPDGDTSTGDNAAIGYTAAEGLILTGQGSTDDITIKNDADTTVLNVTTGGTNVEISAGNLLFGTASKGVYLGVDGATASNLLDDYEEGTWTCVVGASGGSFTAGAQSVTGTYTKTGRDVHVQAYVANVDTSGTSGYLFFTGLPLSAAAVSIGSIGLYNIGAASAVGAWAEIAATATLIRPYTNVNGYPWTQTTISAGSGRYAIIDVTYQHDP